MPCSGFALFRHRLRERLRVASPAYTPDLEAVMEKYDPSLFCLNDDARMTDEDRLRVRHILGEVVSEKSSFESSR